MSEEKKWYDDVKTHRDSEVCPYAGRVFQPEQVKNFSFKSKNWMNGDADGDVAYVTEGGLLFIKAKDLLRVMGSRDNSMWNTRVRENEKGYAYITSIIRKVNARGTTRYWVAFIEKSCIERVLAGEGEKKPVYGRLDVLEELLQALKAA